MGATGRMNRRLPTIDGRALTEIFQGNGVATGERVGIEVEMATLDPGTGFGTAYEGARGMRRLLEALLAEQGGDPLYDGGLLMGFRRADGTKISLEPSGALEYSSPPMPSVTTLIHVTDRELTALAAQAADFGIALVPGGTYPYTDVAGITWTPSHRIQLQRDYFAGPGEGTTSAQIMALSLSTQVTLDYVTLDDLAEKVRMQTTVSPVAAALFVNSPVSGGQPTGSRSRRMEYWLEHSPQRTGILSPALSNDFSADSFTAWAIEIPMIYRQQDHGWAPAPRRPFRDLVCNGFGDGTWPSWSDWESHLSQIWTDVRLRRTIELRAFDGPPRDHLATVPALWTGLSYHPPSRAAAWELTGGRSEAEYYAAMRDVAHRGIHAYFGEQPVAEVAEELLHLANEGLRARVADGLEQPEVLSYLEPLEETIKTKLTWADTILRRWTTEFQNRPDRFVRAYRL